MSTELFERGVDLNIKDEVEASPSYLLVKDLVESSTPSHSGGDPMDRDAFSLTFLPAPDLKLENKFGFVGFVEIGKLFNLNDYFTHESPNSEASNVPRCDKVTRLLNKVFPQQNVAPYPEQQQLGITGARVPVFNKDTLTEQLFPDRETSDYLILQCIKAQDIKLEAKWAAVQKKAQLMSDTNIKGAENRLERGQEFRTTEETVQEMGEDNMKEKIAELLASSFTAAAQMNFHILQTLDCMEKMTQYRKEFNEYKNIIPDIVQKVQLIYLRNHRVYKALESELEKSKDNWSIDELDEFVAETKALNKISMLHMTDVNEKTLNASINEYFRQKMFEEDNNIALPFDRVLKHLEELHTIAMKPETPSVDFHMSNDDDDDNDDDDHIIISSSDQTKTL